MIAIAEKMFSNRDDDMETGSRNDRSPFSEAIAGIGQ